MNNPLVDFDWGEHPVKWGSGSLFREIPSQSSFALWITSTSLGLPVDRVLLRSCLANQKHALTSVEPIWELSFLPREPGSSGG